MQPQPHSPFSRSLIRLTMLKFMWLLCGRSSKIPVTRISERSPRRMTVIVCPTTLIPPKRFSASLRLSTRSSTFFSAVDLSP